MMQNIEKTYSSINMNDTTDLCVLGILFDEVRTSQGVMGVVRSMGTGGWQPTNEVIDFTLERLLASGLIMTRDYENDVYFSITGEGIKHFFALIKRPLAVNMGMADSQIALKSCFLEVIPYAVRDNVVEELKGYYSCKLKGLESDCVACPLQTERVQVQQGHQMNLIRQELDWLNQLVPVPLPQFV